MMEVFAEKGIESEKAGTQFRNILLRLASGADETNPAIVGLEKAIENLGNQNLSTAETAKLFGVENVLAGQIMIQSGERFAEFTQKVTGTDVALEQARARVDNMKGDLKSLGSITQEYAIIIGGLISKGLRPVVQGLTAFLLSLKELPNFIRENKGLLITFVSALVAFNSAQIISTGLLLKDIAVKKAQIIWTTATTVAQRGLNAAMTANPIGLIIKATALLVSGFALLYNSSQRVRGAVAGIGEVASTVWEIIKETFGNFAGAFSKILSGDVLGGMKDLGTAIIKSNPIVLAVNEGKRLGSAFMKGYNERIDMEDAKKLVQEEGDLVTGTGGGMNEDDPEDPSGTDSSGVPGDPEKAKEKLDQLATQWKDYQERVQDITREYALSKLSEEEKERELVWEKYAKLEDDLLEHLTNQTITEDTFHEKAKELEDLRQQELYDIRLKWREKEEEEKAKALEEIEKATDILKTDEEILEDDIASVEDFYDDLIVLAEKFGQDTAALEAARRKTIKGIQDQADKEEYAAWLEKFNAKKEMYVGFGSAAIGVLDMVNSFEKDSGEFGKYMAIGTAAVKSGEAIANMVAAFSKTNPEPISLAVSIAAGITTIATSIASAVRSINSSNFP
jgi:hypothetical protein